MADAPSEQSWKEIAKLGLSLGFSAVYMVVHHSERSSVLRVAALAKRFLDGADVPAINQDADTANALRRRAGETALASPRQHWRNRIRSPLRRKKRI